MTKKNKRTKNSILKAIIIRFVLKPKGSHPKKYSPYEIAKGYYQLRVLTKQQISDVIFMIAGVLSAAFGLESFLIPNHFIDGGVTGISMLVSTVTGWPLYFLLAAINLPFIFMGGKIVSKAFAVKTAFTILGLTLCVA